MITKKILKLRLKIAVNNFRIINSRIKINTIDKILRMIGEYDKFHKRMKFSREAKHAAKYIVERLMYRDIDEIKVRIMLDKDGNKIYNQDDFEKLKRDLLYINMSIEEMTIYTSKDWDIAERNKLDDSFQDEVIDYISKTKGVEIRLDSFLEYKEYGLSHDSNWPNDIDEKAEAIMYYTISLKDDVRKKIDGILAKKK